MGQVKRQLMVEEELNKLIAGLNEIKDTVLEDCHDNIVMTKELKDLLANPPEKAPPLEIIFLIKAQMLVWKRLLTEREGKFEVFVELKNEIDKEGYNDFPKVAEVRKALQEVMNPMMVALERSRECLKELKDFTDKQEASHES